MIQLQVCIGSACHVKGSYNVVSSFQQLIEEYHLAEKVEVASIFCLGHCTEAVAVRINNGEVASVTGASAREFFEQQVLPLTAG